MVSWSVREHHRVTLVRVPLSPLASIFLRITPINLAFGSQLLQATTNIINRPLSNTNDECEAATRRCG